MRDIDFVTKLLSLKRPWKVERVSLSLEEKGFIRVSCG
jgi:hypothetical protein